MTQQAIGIFDSGVGGLSVAKAISELLPNENLIYFADSAYAPYGEKALSTIEQRSEYIVHKLLERNVKAIVVACNTATVNIISLLRARLSIPVIGIEPGIKPAAKLSKTNKVAVIATENTIHSKSFLDLSEQHSQGVDVFFQACPRFVELVENHQLGTEQSLKVAKEYISPLIDKQCDQIVLGCTHFPFLEKEILAACEGKAQLVDTSVAVATQLKRVLTQKFLLNVELSKESDEFLTSGDVHAVTDLISSLWGKQVTVFSS